MVDGSVLDDPYDVRVEKALYFEVISDDGPGYQVEQVDHRRWTMRPVDPGKGGTVYAGGNALNRWYSYKREGRFLPLGQQNMFINAVFGLVGELDRDLKKSSST